jgi:hypothetical protein
MQGPTYMQLHTGAYVQVTTEKHMEPRDSLVSLMHVLLTNAQQFGGYDATKSQQKGGAGKSHAYNCPSFRIKSLLLPSPLSFFFLEILEPLCRSYPGT